MKRLAWLVVGVVLFRFWRIAQRHKAEIEDMRMRWLASQMITGGEGPYSREDWSNVFSVTDKDGHDRGHGDAAFWAKDGDI